jgi:hypothetical protein
MRTETLLDLADKWDPQPNAMRVEADDALAGEAEARRARRQCAQDLRALLELLS